MSLFHHATLLRIARGVDFRISEINAGAKSYSANAAFRSETMLTYRSVVDCYPTLVADLEKNTQLRVSLIEYLTALCKLDRLAYNKRPNKTSIEDLRTECETLFENFEVIRKLSGGCDDMQISPNVVR
jgi:hypothetical protein